MELEELFNFINPATFKSGITIIFICTILASIAAFIDMWAGIDAARANKEKISSRALRKTVSKIIDYFRIVMFSVLIDILGLCFTWYNLPYACILVTFGILIIEGYSIIENLRKKKSHAAEVVDIVTKIIECTDNDTAQKIINAIKDAKQGKQETTAK